MTAPASSKLNETAQSVKTGCVECGICVKGCDFLKFYGTPKKIAETCPEGSADSSSMAYECSLCGYCRAVCPFGVDPEALFLEYRREAVKRGEGPLPEHKNLLAYERAGNSKRFSWYALPAGCDTVFFPGCALPGTRPETTEWAFHELAETIPNLGLVLDCCNKPSHDLGREEHFGAMFGELYEYLKAHGIKRVIVACPNCWKVFGRYAPELTVETIYELLEIAPGTEGVELAATVHDPCVMRDAASVSDAVRKVAGNCGVTLTEMEHNRARTLCCGEGGGVGMVAPDLAEKWGSVRVEEAGERPIITYCAGCANLLAKRGGEVAHVLDVARDPKAALTGGARVSTGLVTYLNRWRLKKRLRAQIPAQTTRERTFSAAKGKGSLLKPLLGLAAFILLLYALRASGFTDYLEEKRLKEFIGSFGAWGPALFMLVYTIAPVFFFPGLPISIVGGVVFGPFWGVIYTITGATMGACLAFLVSRYVARGFVERRLVGSKWRMLDEKIAENGWKVVLFTRLVPLFPFNMLNYAFGMTRVSFGGYAFATFFGMLPATIAFITFSTSLVDLLRGKVSPQLLLGILLMVGVSLIPKLVKKLKEPKKPKTAKRKRAYSLGLSLKRKALIAGIGLGAWLGWKVLGEKLYNAFGGYIDVIEFNIDFIKNRFADSNQALLTEYFSALGAVKFAVMSGVVAFRQTYVNPFAKLEPYAALLAVKPVWGAVVGLAAGFWLVGLLTFGAALYLFSDVRPLLARKNGLSDAPPLGIVGEGIALALAALPGPPLWAAPLLLALGRAKPHRAGLALLLGAFVRAAVTYLALK